MTSASQSKKRRQHYVWRHYLDAWTVDGSLWCRRGDAVFPVSPKNVANQRDFYRLREMSEHDLAVVKQALINPLAPPLRELAEGWIPHFTELFEMKRRLEAKSPRDPVLEAAVDTAVNNLEENLHSRLEGHGVALLAALRARDVSIFDDDEESIFHTWFLAAQMFRTPGMLQRVVRATNQSSFNAEASFGLVRTIVSNTFGHALWVRRGSLRATFLRAPNGRTFITGDQPVVNLKAIGLSEDEEARELQLYYPLSPELALQLDFDAGERSSETQTLAGSAMTEFNRVITAMSHEQVYGAELGDLHGPGSEGAIGAMQ